MNYNELIILRMNLLGGMNSYIYDEIAANDVTSAWEKLGGMSEDITEDELKSVATDAIEWERICNLFGTLINM